MRTVYVNGAYVPEDQATVSVFDRGFLFADAVYEVTSVVGGQLIDFDGHITRLLRSLAELDMAVPCSKQELLDIHRAMVEKNNLNEGVVYLQITRGAADRDFDFSNHQAAPTMVLFTQAKKLVENPLAARGQNVVLVEDLRWGRADIKTVQLLYSSLMKTRAKKKGADDVWLCKDGQITEGSSNNAYIVTENNEIITRQLSNDILHGITRAAVLDVARSCQMTVIERAFSSTELKQAKEAFSTSASGFVAPVVSVDGIEIGKGTVGPVAKQLRAAYLELSLNKAV